MAISRLTLQNVLSFGPEAHAVELRTLNVIIGANGSGKSNLVDVFGLLHALPTDVAAAIREGGGIAEWLWKGAGNDGVARVSVAFGGWAGGEYEIRFGRSWNGRLKIGSETDLSDEPIQLRGDAAPEDRSALSLPGGPHLSLWSENFRDIAVYRDFAAARGAPIRFPQPADLPNDRLQRDGLNLGVMLSTMQAHPKAWDALHEAMGRFNPAFRAVRTIVSGGTVQLLVQEHGLDKLIPATRLSEGTLRYLILLTLLLSPARPEVLVIEEPEAGLHPDVIPEVARLLREASQRVQLVVTTHSDHLVDALSADPECVLVAEREERGTRLRRLEAAPLAAWLERYRLGELWLKGELGGTRW